MNFALLQIVLVISIALGLAAFMADPVVQGPVDTGKVLQAAAVTKTATFNSTGLDLGSGYAPGGGGQAFQAMVPISAADFVSTDETYTFKLQHSADDSTYTDAGAAVSALAGNVGASVVVHGVTAAITSALVAANWDCIVANLPAYYNADITEIPMADARSRVSSLFQTALALLAIGPVTLPNTAAASWGAGTTAANLPTCLLIDNGVPSDAYTEKTSAGVTKICETADGWRITVAAGEDFPATPSLYDSAFQVVIEITLSGGTCCGGTGLPTVEVHFYLKHMLWLTPAVAAAFLGPGHDPVFPDGCSAGAWCTWQLDSWLIDDASLSGCALPDPALTADIAVNNNKCCRCSGGDCVNSSDASNAVCDGGGVNTCVDGQDADCGPFP